MPKVYGNRVSGGLGRSIGERKFLSFSEATAYLESHFAGWEDGLTEDSTAAIKAYQTYLYTTINDALRTGEEGYFGSKFTKETFISAMDAAFSSTAPITNNLTAYRGYTMADADIPKVGNVFKDKAYLSTSVNPEIAQKFSKGELGAPNPGETIVVQTMRVRPGAVAMPITKLAPHLGQDELLFNRNTRQKVTSRTERIEVVNGKATKIVELGIDVL